MQTHRGETHRHRWEQSAHIGNLRIHECWECGAERREEDAPGDTLGERLRAGYYREQTRADPDALERAQARPEPGQGRPAEAPENGKASAAWEGCWVTNRLNLSWDDRMEWWTVNGRYEHSAATGTGTDMVRLAIAILSHLPDAEGNGPPMDPALEADPRRPGAAQALARAVDLARAGPEGTGRTSRRRLAGALMAVAVHMLQEDGGEEWTMAGTPPFPFSMRLKPQ